MWIQNGTTLQEKNLAILAELHMHLSRNSAIWHLTEDKLAKVWNDTCRGLFVILLFEIAKDRNNSSVLQQLTGWTILENSAAAKQRKVTSIQQYADNSMVDFNWKQQSGENCIKLYLLFFFEIVIFLVFTSLPHIHTSQHHITSGEVQLDALIYSESQKQKWNVLLPLPSVRIFLVILSKLLRQQGSAAVSCCLKPDLGNVKSLSDQVALLRFIISDWPGPKTRSRDFPKKDPHDNEVV